VAGAGLGDDLFRLSQRRGGGLKVLVRDVDAPLQPIEDRIVVDRPPRTAADRVVRLAELPSRLRPRLFVLRRRRGSRALVIRSDRAGGQQRSGRGGARTWQAPLPPQ